MQLENFRKLFDETVTTPKEILDELKHRLNRVSFGLYFAHELKNNSFGFNPITEEHVPLKFGRTSTDVFLDEKTDPELYRKYQWQQEHAKELSVLDRISAREIISVQDRADILVGAFAYWISWAPEFSIGRILPEITWTQDQPETAIIEKYQPLITKVRQEIENLERNDPSLPGHNTYTYLRDLDKAMEKQGFLWDKEKKEYINLGLSH